MVAPQPPWPPEAPPHSVNRAVSSALQSPGIFWRRARKVLCAAVPFSCARLLPAMLLSQQVLTPPHCRCHHPHALSFVKTMFPPPLIFRGTPVKAPGPWLYLHTCCEPPLHTRPDADLRGTSVITRMGRACPLLPGPLKILQIPKAGREDDC